MDIKKKSEDFLLIEDCFKDIKDKRNIQDNLNKIARVLKRSFDLTFDIKVIDNDTNTFFGMTIYPERSTVDAIVNSILDARPRTDTLMEIWQKNETWYLEIDSILLYDKNLNTNPQEITAVLLHEIGHIVYSNSVPQRVNKILRYESMQLNHGMKELIKDYKMKKLFSLTVIEACSSKNYSYVNTDIERVADKFVTKMGYGEELNNFINKLIASQGNKLINRTEGELDSDVKTIVNWSIDNISELEYRKKKLKGSIQAELIKNPSLYVKDVFTSIQRAFFGEDRDNYAEMLSEQYLVQSTKKIVQESILDLFDNVGKIKKMSQSDIDILSIEVDKIVNNDDKIYVLDLIYDKLDVVNGALEYIEKGKLDKVSQSKQTLTNFKTQLEKMRQQVLNIQVKDKQYGVFIKYPKGYEG